MPRIKPQYRCRKCGKEFALPPTPKRAMLVKCPKCKSTDVEFM